MKISSGIIKEPFFVLIAGVPGIGKTTFAADAPSPVMLGPERGSTRMNTKRFDDINTFDDFVKGIQYLRNEKHDFKSVGIDSLDAIEPLIWQKVCIDYKVKSIEDCGYGKGYTAALDYWQSVIDSLKDLRKNREMNIICIGHTHIKTINDPLHMTPYDRHVIKLNEKAAAKWREVVDALLFANYEDQVFKLREKDTKAKATGPGIRKLYTNRHSSWDAKNRLGLPDELPLSYQAFADAAEVGMPDSLENIMKGLTECLTEFETRDKDMYARMQAGIQKAAGDIPKLLNILNYANKVREA